MLVPCTTTNEVISMYKHQLQKIKCKKRMNVKIKIQNESGKIYKPSAKILLYSVSYLKTIIMPQIKSIINSNTLYENIMFVLSINITKQSQMKCCLMPSNLKPKGKRKRKRKERGRELNAFEMKTNKEPLNKKRKTLY